MWGVTDCWSLVVDWYKEEKGIKLKDYKRSMTPQEFLENPLFEDYAWRTGFRELRPDDEPCRKRRCVINVNIASKFKSCGYFSWGYGFTSFSR